VDGEGEKPRGFDKIVGINFERALARPKGSAQGCAELIPLSPPIK